MAHNLVIRMVNSTPQPQPAAIAYSRKTQLRAERAVRCSPFRLRLFQVLQDQSVSIEALADNQGIHNGYTRYPLSELAAENAMLWLLAVGLLRREVDGQGLTDSFRLTPLGRRLLADWERQGVPDLTPRFQDHLYNALNRWLRLPGWLQP